MTWCDSELTTSKVATCHARLWRNPTARTGFGPGSDRRWIGSLPFISQARSLSPPRLPVQLPKGRRAADHLSPEISNLMSALYRCAASATSWLNRVLWDSAMASSTPDRAAGGPERGPTDIQPRPQHRINLDWTRDPPPPSITPHQQLLRGIDWSATDLGPMSGWSRELRQMVRFMMAKNTPAIIYWGDTNTIIYNEAHVPLVGDQHPEILGRRAFDVFPEFWNDFELVIIEQRRTGAPASGDASMLLMQRHGFLEETYFNWTLIPVINDEGHHVGCCGAALDKTRDIIGQRRRDCAALLAQETSRATTLEELWDKTVMAFDTNEKDVPFALLYSVESQVGVSSSPSRPSYDCRLQRAIGVTAPHALAQEYVDVQDVAQGGFAPAMLDAIKTKTLQVVDYEEAHLEQLLDGVKWVGFGTPSCQFAIVPIFVHHHIFAVLVIGLNPRRRFNPMYRAFFDSIADILAPQIHRIRLSEEVTRRAELARRATLAFEKSEGRFSRFAERTIVGLATIDNGGRVSPSPTSEMVRSTTADHGTTGRLC